MCRCRSTGLTLAGVAAVIVAAGCIQEMADQPRYEPLQPSEAFDDGMSARSPVPGTVPRGELQLDEPFYTGKSTGKPVASLPPQVLAGRTITELLTRGRERYSIFCAQCHGQVGGGIGGAKEYEALVGMVVKRGFPSPPTYHQPRLRQAPVGHFFDVITNGFGRMPAHGYLVLPEDRWAIVTYIRALQLSQNAPASDLPAEERQRLDAQTMGALQISLVDNVAMVHSHEILRTWQRWSLVAAVVGAVVCAAISWDRPADLWRAYLAAYMLCWPVTLGAAGLLAIGNLTGGNWAMAARPAYLASVRTIPLVGILFIPIALSLGQIYPWVAPSSEAAHTMSPSKAAWLSPTFFLWRAGGYLAVWLVLIGMLNLVSRAGVRPAATPAMRRVGALTLVLLAPTATFAAFDWAMSLEPAWYSSIYGAIITAGGVLAAHALAVSTLAATTGNVHTSAVEKAEPAAQVYNDLGNLLLAFLMVFGYLSFSQFLIIWSGNLPIEIAWYLRRLNGGWQWVGLAMVLLCFFAFFQMLSRDRKSTPGLLVRIAALVLVAYCIHTYWIMVPAFDQTGPAWQVTNVAAMAALAGGWMAAFCWHAGRCLDAYQIDAEIGGNDH